MFGVLLCLVPAVGRAQGTPSSQDPAAQQVSADEALEYSKRIGPPFPNCDGYGDPNSHGDGMTKEALQLGIFISSGNRRLSIPSLGRSGILACSLALAQLERSQPGYWMRRVSLLRARALHRIADGDPKGALADLDAADAAAARPNDPYYRRSLKLGIDLLRALALRRSGNLQDAETLALSASDSRPFSRQTAAAALAVIGPDADFKARELLLRRVSQLDPNVTGELFDETFEDRQYAKAIDLYGALHPPVKAGDEPMQFRQRILLEQDNRAAAVRFWITACGEKAYALAALGRAQDARAALAEAEARLAAATPAPPPLPPEASDDQRLRHAVIEQTNLKIQTTVPPVLGIWAGMTEARLLLAEDKVREAVERFHSIGKLPPSWATIDFLEAAAPRLPPEQRPNLPSWRIQLRVAQRTTDPDNELQAIARSLPEAETPQRVPAAHHSNWLYTVNGYEEKQIAGTSSLTVKYRDVDTTEAMSQEAALLRAAELGERSGKKAMLVTGMRDIEHTIVNTMYGRPVASIPTGYETDMDVAFVDPADIATSAPAESWRLIDVAAVRTQLADLYRPGDAAAPGAAP